MRALHVGLEASQSHLHWGYAHHPRVLPADSSATDTGAVRDAARTWPLTQRLMRRRYQQLRLFLIGSQRALRPAGAGGAAHGDDSARGITEAVIRST